MKYKLNSDVFLSLVTDGNIIDLDRERIDIFIKILPKAGEIQKLKEAVLSEGCSSIDEALANNVEFGKVEEFMIKTLKWPNLEVKA